MSQEWMIDVLTDLKNFALANGLMALAEQLDDSILIAVTELKLKDQKTALIGGNATLNFGVPRTLAAGENI